MTPDLQHPITDVDATFAATAPKDTHRLMEALRENGINFDVTVNGPQDDPSLPKYDIFWFRKEDDQEMIGRVIKKTFSDNEQT